MKNKLLFSLTLLTILSCSPISNNQISISPKFIVGETFEYSIIHSLKLDGDLSYQQNSDVTISVEKVQDSIITINWTINEIDIRDSTEFKDLRTSIFEIPEGMTIVYDVNRKGQIQQINNYNAIQKTLDSRFDSVMMSISENREVSRTYKESGGFGIMKAMIYDKPENNIFISDIFHFNRLNGIEIIKDTSIYHFEPWVGSNMDKYRIYLCEIDDREISIKSDLVVGKGSAKNGRVTTRQYTYDPSSFWLKDLSSIMRNEGIEDKMVIKQR